MFNLTKKPFREYSYRLARLILVGTVLFAPFLIPRVAQVQVTEKEPIAYIGHGAMFNQNGQEVAPSITFIREAQAWYRTELIKKLTKNQRVQFNQFQRGLTKGLALDEQSQLVLNAHLLDWLLNVAKVENGDRIRGKNNLMKFLLKTKLPERSDSALPQSTEPFNINPQLLKRLTTTGKVKVQMLTDSGGAAYRAECLANGVPIPPDMGNSAWVSRGLIPQSRLFIVRGNGAEVLTYQSTSPEGMCVALPRFNTSSNIVSLDGVICLGKATSKACFWDNEKNGIPFTFTRGDAVPFSDFGGGTELLGSVGGVCSDCHAGENPYIIHPDPSTILGGLADLGLPTFANNWHEPLVRTGDTNPWPENPGPMNAPLSCVGCHFQGFAGRFPHLSTAMRNYCGTILRTAIGALPPDQPNPPPTMPPSNPGGLVCTPNLPTSDPQYRACTSAMTASCNSDSTLTPSDPLYLRCTPEVSTLLNWCGIAASGDASGRGDPHITTFDGVNYDFQSAGEFIYLRDAGGLEIQTRQTPVSTESIVGPNPHTGLTSCVSINTAVAARVGKYRVSYQPSFTDVSERSVLELHIDGKVTEIGPQGINLGSGRIVKAEVGSGIEIYFPDKTHLIVTPGWWASQNMWYMNVDVLNTPGRDGVMGAIAPGSWLPALPNGMSLGPIPALLHQRYVDLNQKFADAWRVNDRTSLFDYAPSASTATFTNRAWPPENPPCIIPESKTPPAKPMDPQKAQELCRAIDDKNMRSQCVFDLTVTGEAGFAKTYLMSQRFRLRPRANKITMKENKYPSKK